MTSSYLKKSNVQINTSHIQRHILYIKLLTSCISCAYIYIKLLTSCGNCVYMDYCYEKAKPVQLSGVKQMQCLDSPADHVIIKHAWTLMSYTNSVMLDQTP